MIGASMKNRGSNEAVLDGKNIVIHCAARKTGSIGVTYNMLPKLDSVIGAFQLDAGSFEPWKLSAKHVESNMRDSRTGAGKVGLIKKRTFIDHGKPLGTIRLNAERTATKKKGLPGQRLKTHTKPS